MFSLQEILMRRSLLLTLLLTLLIGLLLAQEARNAGASRPATSVPTVSSLPAAAEQAMATVNPELSLD